MGGGSSSETKKSRKSASPIIFNLPFVPMKPWFVMIMSVFCTLTISSGAKSRCPSVLKISSFTIASSLVK